VPAEKEEKKRSELLIWDFPDDLRRKFKAKCAMLKITMKEAIVDLISKFCDK